MKLIPGLASPILGIGHVVLGVFRRFEHRGMDGRSEVGRLLLTLSVEVFEVVRRGAEQFLHSAVGDEGLLRMVGGVVHRGREAARRDAINDVLQQLLELIPIRQQGGGDIEILVQKN